MSFGNDDLSAPDYAKLSNKNQKIYTNDLDN